MNTEVFISYASKDRKRIIELVDRLNSAGVSVWIDQMSIEGATMWSQEIVAAIRNCKVLILAISENSADSENVVKEVALASEGRKRILPVYLESAEIPESMAYQLAGIQRVEFFEGQEESGLQSMIRALAKLGVTVNEEASTAAAESPKRTTHGASHSKANQASKSEGAAWVKIAAAAIGLALVASSIFFLGGRNETSIPLDQSGTNSVTKAQPLAYMATLDTNRVVVLPFKVIGSSKESENLGYGLVSTLTSKLQPLQNLVIIANESARKFKDTELSPREIGQALEVGTIVTGEIQTSGSKVQVNIRVIDANTEALGWGNTFTKNMNEYLDLQNEIATRLASELKGGLVASETQQLARKATENQEAQAEYQAGRREWNKRSKAGFENAIKHFERAIELDPNYADPYAGLGDTYGLLPIYNFSPASEAMPKAKFHAKKAMELNPKLPGAYTSLAWVLHKYDYDWEGAEFNYRKAVELNPNYASANHWYGIFLHEIGKSKDAASKLDIAAQLAPTSLIIQYTVGEVNCGLGNEEKALNAVEKALAIDPNFAFALRVKYVLLKVGKPEESIGRYKEAIKVYPNQPVLRHGLFELYWQAGKKSEAMEQVIEILDRYHDSYEKSRFAELFFAMGKKENAYRWLGKAIEAKESTVPRLANTRELRNVQSEPRFREFYKKINHPMYLD